VTYTATTASGNTGTLTRTVNVVPVPNDTLQLDFAPTSGTVQPAPAGFTKVQNAAALAVGNYSFPGVADSSYTLSFANIGSYNTGNTNEPLVTDGFYSFGPNGPAYFTLSGLPVGMQVTLYAIYAWDGSDKYAHVFFGDTDAQIVYNGDPGMSPTLASFTKIGVTAVGPSCAVSGYWQGPGGPNSEGQVGAMVFLVAATEAAPCRLSAPVFTNGVCQIVAQGAANANYALEAATSLNPPVIWTPVVTNQASASGQVLFIATPSPDTGFYRTRAVP
jgi:hypothetical protein